MTDVEKQKLLEDYKNTALHDPRMLKPEDRARVERRFLELRQQVIAAYGYDPLAPPLTAKDFGF